MFHSCFFHAKHTLAIAGVILSATAATAQSTLYSTGFEASDGFAVGNLNGQNAWSVNPEGTGEVSPGIGAGGSARFAELGNNTVVTRGAPSSSAQVLVRGSYRGVGSYTLAAPDTANPIAALIGFRRIDGNSIAVAAYNGTTGLWVEPAPAVGFSNTSWHEIVLALDYSTKTFNVQVDGQNHLQGIGFRDVAVTQLHGFGASSRAAADLDSVGLYASGINGDYDSDGWTDKYETSGGDADPFLGTSTTDFVAGNEPNLGNLNGDGFHNAADYNLLAAAIVNSTALVATGDMNGDGVVDVRDVTHFGNRVANVIAVMR